MKPPIEPSLIVTFTWDNTAGIFYGTLPSGARFAVDRAHVGGKLEANLSLFRQAVMPRTDARRKEPSKEEIRREIANLPDDVPVNVIASGRKVRVELEDLDLSLLGASNGNHHNRTNP